MHKRIWFILGFCQILSFCLLAQDQTTTEKKSNHYVGLQVNQLIRQVFNFGGGNTVASNPYFLIYQVNSIQGGFGLNIGFGYTYTQTDDGDQFVDRTTTVNDLFLRAGLEKKIEIAPKTILSIGGDVVTDFQKTSTKTDENSQGQLGFETGTKSNGLGIGPRITLNYALTDKILIGTEANWYFKHFTIKEYQGDFFEIEKKQKRFQFSAPAVIFLILKF
jgi:hypothetical protein